MQRYLTGGCHDQGLHLFVPLRKDGRRTQTKISLSELLRVVSFNEAPWLILWQRDAALL